MHRIGRDGIDCPELKKRDAAIFAFGEIDVRCHIGKQRDLHNRSLEEIIETLVKSYIASIKSVRDRHDQVVYIIFNIVPPTNDCYNPSFPFYGTIEDRVHITQLLNSRLKKACNEFGFLFLDVNSFYATPFGTLNRELSDKCVHILDNKKVKDELVFLLTGFMPV